jgi:cytochrome P450
VLPDLPFIPPVKRALEARRTLASLIEQELARLRQTKQSEDTEGDHLLQLLAQVKQEDGSWLPIEQSVDTVLQMFYYGQANTANHLTWLIAHMSQRGHAQDLHRVRREQRRVMGESEEFAYSQFSSFRELEQCIQEVTRLYFTTTLPPRKALKSFKFEGFTIPEGSLLCVSPILGHLDSDIFPDAGIFFPKRFAPPKKKQAPETKTAFNPSSFYGMAFVQFGYGMHKCPAEKYAMMLLTSFFSVLVRNHSVELQDNKLPLPQYPATFGTASPMADILVRLQPYAIPRELMFEEDEPEVIRSILPPAH